MSQHRVVLAAVIGDVIGIVWWLGLMIASLAVGQSATDLTFYTVHLAVMIASLELIGTYLDGTKKVSWWRYVSRIVLAFVGIAADVFSLAGHILTFTPVFNTLNTLILVFWAFIVLIDIIYIVGVFVAYRGRVSKPEAPLKSRAHIPLTDQVWN